VSVLGVQDGLDAVGLGAPRGTAERAEHVVRVQVDALADERRAAAVGTAVTVAGERPQALAQELALEVGT
jgi:hypothetical protein